MIEWACGSRWSAFRIIALNAVFLLCMHKQLISIARDSRGISENYTVTRSWSRCACARWISSILLWIFGKMNWPAPMGANFCTITQCESLRFRRKSRFDWPMTRLRASAHSILFRIFLMPPIQGYLSADSTQNNRDALFTRNCNTWLRPCLCTTFCTEALSQ